MDIFFTLFLMSFLAAFSFAMGTAWGEHRIKKKYDCSLKGHLPGAWEYYQQPLGRRGYVEKRRRMCQVCKDFEIEFVEEQK